MKRLARYSFLGLVACGSAQEASKPTAPAATVVPEEPLVPVAAACRGASLEVTPPFDACGCDATRQVTSGGHTATLVGAFCGRAHENETIALPLEVLLDRPVVRAGDDFAIVLRVKNPTASPVVIRIPRRDMHARLAMPNGDSLPHEALSSGGHEEGLIELLAGGTLRIPLTVSGRYGKWTGTDADARIVLSAPPPGDYAVRIFTFGFVGVEGRLVPIKLE